jgi:CcmD family protein
MNVEYLFYANIAVWAGVAAYLLILARGQGALLRRVEQLEIAGEVTDNG